MSNPNRRGFLGGLLAASLTPTVTWADAGSPAFLSAARLADGTFVLCGIAADFRTRFQIPLPSRGHAAAAHPARPEAVAFARRPGTYALVIDCMTGRTTAELTAPSGRHFYGHGTFSDDGSLLFTTENDFEAGRGCIGVWDANHGYARIAEWDSGGIGPHDIRRLPSSDVLVIANGGIETHPDTGRAKLNIPTMSSNLSYVRDGRLIDIAELPADHQRNSIRHLAVRGDGTVAFGMQWQGESTSQPLVGLHRPGEAIALMRTSPDNWHAMNGYVGSIAFDEAGARVAATSPRGNTALVFDASTRSVVAHHRLDDICGVAKHNLGFATSTGGGRLVEMRDHRLTRWNLNDLAWDNHLVEVSSGL